jgi:acyl-CoA hydrolase
MAPLKIDLDQLPRYLHSLRDHPRVIASGNHATPWEILNAFDAAVERYNLFLLNGQRGLPDREGVTLETTFVGSGQRKSPHLRYIPGRLSLTPNLFKGELFPDVVLLHTSRAENGKYSLGVEVNILPAAIEMVKARNGLVIVQANKQMPYTFGDAEIEAGDVDLVIEVDVPLDNPHRSSLTPASEAIGGLVASMVSNGSTLQTGIGAVPDAVLHSLINHKGMAVWTEMFSDGVWALEKAGALDTSVPITASFLFGSPGFYAWIDHNERIRMFRTEKTNDPARIHQNHNMVSVNTAIQVDLFGQANASRLGTQIYSGFGGQTDFLVGALHSRSGLAVMALNSWHPKANVSTVVPLLEAPVTSFQQSVIVTEQGIAPLAGFDQCAQAQHIIERAAHPDARPFLREKAKDFGLMS